MASHIACALLVIAAFVCDGTLAYYGGGMMPAFPGARCGGPQTCMGGSFCYQQVCCCPTGFVIRAQACVAPRPMPIPRPMPVPVPVAAPVPYPSPVAVPVPRPVPAPVPMPFPQPVPVPRPVPVPHAVPVPIPMPVPVPRPLPPPPAPAPCGFGFTMVASSCVPMGRMPMGFGAPLPCGGGCGGGAACLNGVCSCGVGMHYVGNACMPVRIPQVR